MICTSLFIKQKSLEILHLKNKNLIFDLMITYHGANFTSHCHYCYTQMGVFAINRRSSRLSAHGSG